MEFLTDSILIGFALAMDCLAVSFAAGAQEKKHRFKTMIVLSVIFGFFQFGMFLIGWFLGSEFISIVSAYDHWIAAFLLFIIGIRMILEGARDGRAGKESPNVLNFYTVVVLAIATSIDAIAVGISFAFLEISPFVPSVIIGLITAGVSGFGVIAGGKAGQIFGERIDILGGAILILIGIRILIEHTV